MSVIPTSPLSAPFQEAELINNKTDKDGHHYLKVLLLSNKKTRNNWIVPYQKISDLPKEVIQSFMDLPHIDEHSYPYFIELKNKLEAQGKSDDDIVNTLKEESKKLGTINYIDHLFMDDPNSSLLYGQLKIMDPKENEFIEKNGRPSKNFTSPGVFGSATTAEDGTEVYNPNTLRAFHLASVDIPAFPEQEASVKAVCSNGNSESCRKMLAVAGFNSTDVPATPALSTIPSPSENVNNPCSCNKNIEMSTNNPQVTVSTDTPPQVNVNTPPPPTNIPAEVNKLTPGASNTTQEAIDAARKEAQKVLEENKQQEAAEQKKKAEENKPQPSEAEIELKRINKQLEEERNEKLEMKNFFLDKIIINAISRDNFAKEEEFTKITEETKGFINKYNMNITDAEWFISKVAKSVTPVESTEDKKAKKNLAVGGWYGNFGSTTYNSDSLTRSQNQTVPQPASGSGSGNGSNLEDEDYPIF